MSYRRSLIRFVAGCFECDFEEEGESGVAQRRVSNHAKQTGHRMWTEVSYAGRYNEKITRESSGAKE